MPSSYPGAFDSLAKPGASTQEDAAGFEHDVVHTRAAEAIEAVQAELGTNPSGVAATVAARLTAVDAAIPTTEQMQDLVAAMLVAGSNITLNYNDTAGTVTITASGGGGGITTEDAQDAVGNIMAGAGIASVNYDDTANTITVTVSVESVQDVVGAMAAAGAGMQVTYDDAAGTVTITNTDRGSTALAGRTVSAGTGLTGGGTLAADRSLAVDFGTTAGKVAAGDDARFTDTRTPTDNSATNAKLADMATARIKGRTSAGTGDPEDLTGTQATALLDVFGAGVKGLVPAAGGSPDAAKFLTETGVFAVPAGGGGGGSLTFKDEGAGSVSRSVLDVRGDTLTVWDDGTNARLSVTGGVSQSPFVNPGAPSADVGSPGEMILTQTNPGSPLNMWGPKPFAAAKSTHRASSGTSRTITLAYAHNFVVGCLVDVVKGSPLDGYTGTRMLVTAVTSTTVTYTHPTTLTESTTVDAGVTVGCRTLPWIAPITNRSSSGTDRTLTTPAAHNFAAGDVIAVSGIDSSYDVTSVVVSAVTSTTFTYTAASSLTESSTASSGTVTLAWSDGNFQRGNGAFPYLGQTSNTQGRAFIPVVDPAAAVLPSPGQRIDITTTLPSSLLQTGSMVYAAGGWKASSGTGVHAAVINASAEPNTAVAVGRVKTLPTSGLLLLGSMDGTFGYVAAITSTGVLKFRRLYSGADLPGASGAGAVVAGDVIMVEKVGRMFTAHVFTYATTGLTYKSTVTAGSFGATSGLDSYWVPSQIGFGVSADTTAEWYGGTTQDGAAWLRLGY